MRSPFMFPASRSLVAALILSIAAFLSPREVASAGEIIGSIGIAQPTGSEADRQTTWGLALRQGLLPTIKLEVGVSYRKAELEGGVSMTQLPVTGSLWWQPLSFLYAGVGAGFYSNSFEKPGGSAFDADEFQFGTHIGAGYRLPLVPKLLSLELQGRYVFLGDPPSELPPSRLDADFWTLSAGAAIGF